MSKVNNNENFVVMSDFHGMKGAMNVVRKYVEEGKKVYILGDATDRGPDGVEILLEIMDLSKKDKVCYIPGNHDQFIYNSYRSNDENWKRSVKDIWTIANNGGNGGLPTWSNLESLKETNLNKFNELMDWLGKQPLQRIVESNNKKYCLAHAFFDQKLYNENSLLCLDDCKDFTFDNPKNISQNILWFRKKDDSYQAEQLPDKDATVIIGHTGTDIYLSKDFFDLENKETGEEIKVINVDGGLFYETNGPDKMIVFDSKDNDVTLVETSVDKQKEAETVINKKIEKKFKDKKDIHMDKVMGEVDPEFRLEALQEEDCKKLYELLKPSLENIEELMKQNASEIGKTSENVDGDFSKLANIGSILANASSMPKVQISQIINNIIDVRERYDLSPIENINEIKKFANERNIDIKENFNREENSDPFEKGEEERGSAERAEGQEEPILTQEIIKEYFKVINLDTKIKQLEEFYKVNSESVPMEFKGNEEVWKRDLEGLKECIDNLNSLKENLENIDNVSENETNMLEKKLSEIVQIFVICNNCGVLTEIENIKSAKFLIKNKLLDYINNLNVREQVLVIPTLCSSIEFGEGWNVLRKKIGFEFEASLLENDLKNTLIDCLKDNRFEEIYLKVKEGNDLTESEKSYLIFSLNSSIDYEYFDEKSIDSILEAIKNIDIANKESKTTGSFKSTDNENIELIDFIKKLQKKLENLDKTGTVVHSAKLKADIYKVEHYLKFLNENKKFSDIDVAGFQKIIDDYPELVKEIVSDENIVNDIKDEFSKLASSEKREDGQSDSRTMNSVSNEQISELIKSLSGELNNFFNNLDDDSKEADVFGRMTALKLLEEKIEREDLDLNDLKKLKDIFKFVEKNITNSNVLTEENKKIIDEIDKSLKHDSESNDQLVDLIDAMVTDLYNISNNTEIMANNQDDYNTALHFMSDLDNLRKRAAKNELEAEDIETISKVIQFIQSFENEYAEDFEINKDEFKDVIDGYKLVGLIGAMLIDLNNIKDNTEIMANNQEAYDTALHFMSDLDNLRKRAAKNELEAEDIETISKAIQFIQSFENEYAEDFEINKDEFKDVIDGFREEALYKDLISFIDDAVKKIDDESNNVRGSKKFNLNRASNDLVKLSKKIKNGGNITDRDVKKFRKVLNNDNVQEILDLSDEEKERYIKTLESLVNKEKDRKDNQTNDGQRGAGEEPDADELGVAKIEKDKKTYLKALAGVAGFAFGAVLGYAVPFPAGLVVTYGIQAVKIATRIASHSLAGKDNKITKVINVAKEKFPRINKFIKSSYVKWAFNGFTLGYTAGTIANKIHKPNLDKTTGGDNSKPHHTPDGTTATDKTPATDGIVHDPTGVGDEPENIVTSLQKGDRWNIRKVADGYGYDSSTMDRRVHLDKDFTNDVIIGKSKIVDGEKMVLVKDNKTKEALAWLKESDILNQGRKR